MVLSPRVQVQVQDNITLSSPGGPATIALIGTAQWGPTDELRAFGSFTQLLEVYKEDKSALTLIKGADLAYNNGAFIVKAIRVVDGNEAKSTIDLDGNSGGTSAVITVEALYPGTYGDNIIVTVESAGSGRTLTVTDGVITEKYTNDDNPNGYASNADLATAVNGNSRLISITVNDSDLVDAVSNQALTGGNDGSSSLTQTNYTDVFDNYLSNEDWDILIIPGGDSLEATDAFQNTILGRVNTRASNDKKYGIYISGVTVDETISAMQSRTAAGERLVLTAPNIKYTPRYAGASQSVFNGTYLACALAGRIAREDVEVSPTRKELNIEGLSVDSTTGKEFYNNAEVEQVLTQRIVPVSRFAGALKVARGVTRITDKTDIDFEINIVRIKDYLRAKVQDTLDPFLGQPNLERVRGVMATSVDGILQAAQLDEIIVAFQPSEVIVGSSPDTVLVNIKVQPTFSINFINVTIAVSRL